MNRRSTWGVVGFLAVAATLGVAWRPGSNSGGANPPEQTNEVRATKVEKPSAAGHDKGLVCDDLADTLQRFLTIENLERPQSCVGASSPNHLPLDLKFVIATLPDPIHTHLSLMFDRSAEVIQEAAQDEGYTYESSWLPWDDKEQTYGSLVDEQITSYRKGLREDQPGVLLFRNTTQSSPKQMRGACASKDLNPGTDMQPYQKGLFVFVVGEDPTSGIHPAQFNNAVQWIGELKKLGSMPCAPVAILGPSFSGSFPSLAKLLYGADSKKKDGLNEILGSKPPRLPIYSGSANSGSDISGFKEFNPPDAPAGELQFDFHSFLERDEVGLARYASYLGKQGFGYDSIALISEDETAYGNVHGNTHGNVLCGDPNITSPAHSPGDGEKDDGKRESQACLDEVLELYYPRDISALRAAYQSNSIFSAPAPQQSSGNVRANLPSDLTDPEGVEHDTIRSYGGNQTTQSQEAYLMGLVEALREHRSQNIILRSTNVLDELFLAQYFRRNYPQARVVIDGSDRLFERERGTPGVGGTLSLSTYPLLVAERDWMPTKASFAGVREFDSDISEGSYIALRLLLHSEALNPTSGQKQASAGCTLKSEMTQSTLPAENIVGALPPLPAACNDLPIAIPDYQTPSWMIPAQCPPQTNDSACDAYRRPSTWLTVLGRDGYAPIAAMNEKTIERSPDRLRNSSMEYRLKVPLALKLWLIVVAGFVLTYWGCCWGASFTVKPAFRTYFAGPNGNTSDLRHPVLICLGSIFLGMLPFFAGVGCGVFDPKLKRFPDNRFVLLVVIGEVLIALGSVAANVRKLQILGKEDKSSPFEFNQFGLCVGWSSVAAIVFTMFAAGFAVPIQASFMNANRLFTYYRSMNLLSGISPMVPFDILALGMFAWFWYSLHGLALFGSDKCRLPTKYDLKLVPDSPEYLRMFSQEDAAEKTEDVAMPLSKKAVVFGGVLSVLSVVLVLVVQVGPHSPIQSLGVSYYSSFFFWCLLAVFVIMLTETWQLWKTWAKLKELLAYLDRVPLRRTIAALHGFSWGTVWGMSGNVLDVRYKLLSRQLESLGHARAALIPVEGADISETASYYVAVRSCASLLRRLRQSKGDFSEPARDEYVKALDRARYGTSEVSMTALDDARKCILGIKVLPIAANGPEDTCIQNCFHTLREILRKKAQDGNAAKSLCIFDLDDTHDEGMRFAEWYSRKYSDPNAGDFSSLGAFQESAARTAGTLLVYLLLPKWREETQSLVMLEPKPAGEGTDDRPESPSMPKEVYIRDAEEFVCLPYLGFVQNILGRMRTNVMSTLFLFVAAAVAISSYPFDPRPGLAEAMLALFLLQGTVITMVYARMHRDSTLSHLTNTNPGELGMDFWLKLAAAGAAPVMGLLATFFPEIANFVSTWLQPGLQSVK